MRVVYERCCGLDVHKTSVVACVLAVGPGGEPRQAVRTFGTMTADILALADWLLGWGCTHVAMESTGVYWKPIWNLLEGSFALLLVNARHIKAVPGRKTDVRDSEWIADLLQHGLLQPSFVPDRPQRELRELTRYRTALIRERAAEVNRLQKTLEGANIKLAAVATDIAGKSGRQIVAALVGGTTDAAALADLAQGRQLLAQPALERALAGCVGPHQRFLLAEQLAHVEYLDASIDRVSGEIRERLRPAEDALARLVTIPGVGRRTAEVLVAEIGTDMRQFPTARHLASWAGLCPGNNASAGQRKGGRTRKGNPWLRTALVEVAQAAGRARRTSLGAQYRRLASRRGKKKACVAVGHTILGIAYHVLDRGTTYEDLGPQHFDRRDRAALERRLVTRLEGLGYKVTLEPVTPAA
jgi:transposase